MLATVSNFKGNKLRRKSGQVKRVANVTQYEAPSPRICGGFSEINRRSMVGEASSGYSLTMLRSKRTKLGISLIKIRYFIWPSGNHVLPGMYIMGEFNDPDGEGKKPDSRSGTGSRRFIMSFSYPRHWETTKTYFSALPSNSLLDNIFGQKKGTADLLPWWYPKVAASILHAIGTENATRA